MITRDESGMILMNYDNEVTIWDITFNTDSYTVITEVYFFKEKFKSTLFCLNINITTFSVGSGTSANWWVTIDQDSTDVNITSEIFDSVNAYPNIFTQTNQFYGWQVFRFDIVASSTKYDFTVSK